MGRTVWYTPSSVKEKVYEKKILAIIILLQKKTLLQQTHQDVLAAFQAQYDEWKAENGSETTDESVEEESSSVAE